MLTSQELSRIQVLIKTQVWNKSAHVLVKTQLEVSSHISGFNEGEWYEAKPDMALKIVENVRIEVPFAGLVNVEEEVERLSKEIAKVQKEIDLFTKKLSNKAFVDKAPAEVVAKDKEKLTEAIVQKQLLEDSLQKVKAIK